MNGRARSSAFVLCIKNDGHKASLELRKVYRRRPDAKGDKKGLIRVIDESGEGYLYPRTWFVPILVPRTARKTFSTTE